MYTYLLVTVYIKNKFNFEQENAIYVFAMDLNYIYF